MDLPTMDGAYGKSRGELLHWLNSVLPPSCTAVGEITKVEQCGSGVPYVHLLPVLFPQSPSALIAPTKVKCPARQEYDSVVNLKILQDVFSRNQVNRVIDVDKMSKRNFQANLEFLQWFKRFCDSRGVGGDLTDAVEQSPPTAAGGHSSTANSPSINQSPSVRKTSGSVSQKLAPGSSPSIKSLFPQGHPSSSRSVASGISRLSDASNAKRPVSPVRPRSKSPLGSSAAGGGPLRSMTPTPGTSSSRLTRPLGTSVTPHDNSTYIELERRFFYDKLRRIEDIIRPLTIHQPTSREDAELALQIQKILYATH